MELTDIHYEKRGQAAWITLDRPHVLNALTPAMITSLEAAADAAVRMEEEAAINCFRTADQREGLAAFLEKRAPVWAGR